MIRKLVWGIGFAICLWIAGIEQASAETVRIVSYNVENLFHPGHDSVAIDSLTRVGKDDWEWTPEGERRWSFTRYYRKVENIARVLTNIGQWEGVDIIGLQEVENTVCVKRLCYTLRRGAYGYVHYESPDQRGIDVALLYKKSTFDTLYTRPVRVDLGEQTTRDILYVCGRIAQRDTLHLLVCHLPSMMGGKAESEWKRTAARTVIRHITDSLLNLSPTAGIIVMGDMNGRPEQDIPGLTNRMIDLQKAGRGTHKWQGRWTCLDQFYTSPAIDSISDVRIYDAEWIQETDEKYLGLKPKRTYNGFRYQNGFSDHLPIVLCLYR